MISFEYQQTREENLVFPYNILRHHIHQEERTPIEVPMKIYHPINWGKHYKNVIDEEAAC